MTDESKEKYLERANAVMARVKEAQAKTSLTQAHRSNAASTKGFDHVLLHFTASDGITSFVPLVAPGPLPPTEERFVLLPDSA